MDHLFHPGVRFTRLALALLAAPVLSHGQNITRTRFTPTVVPETFINPVRFEATVSPAVASVNFTYNAVGRPMFDNGTNGDLVAGDSTWTILFTANEILSKNTAARVFRPFIGTCTPAGGGALNVVAECWTAAIGLPPVRAIDATGQETDYIANYVATTAQLLTFNAQVWAQRFYTTHGDKYDFLNFVHIAGTRGNRFHAGVKNTVTGISTSTYNNTALYGSAGRLQGYNNFPISSFFDGGDAGFEHETGHQWINFLQGTAYASGVPHWPKGNVAINVMGFSIGGGGGQGGVYNFTFTPNGSGGFVVGAGQSINQTIFNPMELYLMGLAAPAEVGTYFVLNDQNLNVSPGQTLTAADITNVTLADVVAVRGPRVPDSTAAQKTFRCATIVVSEQLLDGYAMALYDFFARRCESKIQHTFASGLATGTCNPWYLATGMRSVMFSKIADDIPTVAISRPGGNMQLSFVGKHGISYQRQGSSNLIGWVDEDAPVPVSAPNAPWEALVTVPVPPPVGVQPKFYRFKMLY